MPVPELLAPIGLALVRDAEIMGAEPYFHELVTGIERVTLPRGRSLLLRVLPTVEAEVAAYRGWARTGRVGAVVVVDVREGDSRPALVRELGLPAVVVGPPVGDDVTTVWTDDDEAVRAAVAHLLDRGHRRLLHVGGPADMLHSRVRREGFEGACRDAGAAGATAVGDYSRASGAVAVSEALSRSGRPTAVVVDSDLMALGALDAAASAGLRVPEELAVLAWDDSAQCQLSVPPLSAVSRDVQAVGEQVGRAVLDVLAGAPPRQHHAAPAVVVARESTAADVTGVVT
ncbi:substrate-binding domain-containing protein [Pseudokineococcus basanitobsidens]|uniref:Substrate-binding domain-containing protein n=1 Tax=Pseudokineococcus basanitobsidens TaxID=1926649 RepID=A0ABU8RM09_9ACTN